MSPPVPTVDIKGHGKFRSWSSRFAWARFRLNGKGDRAVCIKTLTQDPVDGAKAQKPHFDDDEFERMREKAVDLLQQRTQGVQPPPPFPVRHLGAPPRPHKTDKCAKCRELGFPCTGHVEDVCGEFFAVPHRVLKDRKLRLDAASTRWLYHQTTEEVAKAIVETQEMKPGRLGLAGGGIYFAASPEDTHGKAQHTGRILRCKVQLGNIKHLGSGGDPSMNIEKLLNDPKGPFDSVLVDRPRPEWVVYLSDQVKNISYV
eukprot:m.341277 g.341277  ORF g.341277 m.341277 type:complete len:258 (+) comp19832_c0_seq3:248-1021(+)